MTLQLRDIADVLLTAFLIYQGFRLFQQTRAIPVIIGVIIFLIFSVGSHFLQLETLSWFFDTISSYFVIAILIILQPELRRLFYRLGQARWYRNFLQVQKISVEEIYQAILNLSDAKIGALLVLVNKTGLRQIAESGITMNAVVSKELLTSVFYEGNPLHDGAVLIEGSVIIAATCYLPLSNSSSLKKTHGARHRAALGISEESDALAIVVSENTGRISAMFLGEMAEGLDSIKIKSLLTAFNSNRLPDEWTLLKGKNVK